MARGATVVSKPELSVYSSFIIDNSDTIYIGDLVTINGDGHAVLATAGDEIAGPVVGFVGPDGELPTLTGTDYLTADSDNETVDAYRAIVDIGRNIRIKIDASASLAEGNRGDHFALVNSYQVDQSTASTTGLDGGLILIDTDPEGISDASMGVYYIGDHQFKFDMATES